MTKLCNTCQQVKPLGDFYLVRRGSDRRQARCKGCDNERTRQRYREKKYDYSKANRRAYLLRTYGITEEQYDEMLESQDGLCAVCLKPETRQATHALEEKLFPLAVHHNHQTGKVLALCCNSCNRGMGLLGDDPEVLHRAATLNEGADRARTSS